MDEILYRSPISEQEIAEALSFFEKPNALAAQQEFVTRFKRKAARGRAVLSLVFSIFAVPFAYIVYLFYLSMPKTSPRGIVLFTAVSILIGAVVAILSSLYRLFQTYSRPVDVYQKRSLEDICLAFYKKLYCEKGSLLRFEPKEDQLMEACEVFPVPVLKKYERKWTEVANKWESCRKKVAQEDISFELQNLEIERNVRDDPRVVNVVIHLKGKPFGCVAFQNVALRIGESWFLMSPEPGEQAISDREEGT
jgi:uncharacterized integral membrane protein